LLCQRPPCRKPGPVLHICFFIGTPGIVFGLKCVLRSDDLPFKKRGQGGMIRGKPCITAMLAQSLGNRVSGLKKLAFYAEIAA
jgi:hypothetical protein